jgi:DNA-binding transcriptional MerR regulator
MSSFILYAPDAQTLACLPHGATAGHSLHTVSQLTGVHPAMLGYYCRLGLIDGVRDDPMRGLVFDWAALDEVRRIEHYRRDLGVQRKALPLMCELWREGERLHIELNFLRAPERSATV